MALRSGFYNAMFVNGDYDRKYNADDYRNVFAAFLKDGVRRSGADDFKVTASGLELTVNLGYAICGGRWCHLDANHTITGITPPVGDYSRIDAVVLRVDENEATRAAEIIYREGTTGANVGPSKDTSSGVSELILAYITVMPLASSVTVEDLRANADFCGWVTTPVGYDDYFESLDAKFYEFLNERKDRLASVTMFKQYVWRTVLEAQATAVAFDIPQYDSTGVDIIEVYTNGIRETEGVNYTLNESVVTFIPNGGNGIKTAGTEIVVVCYKSIDGTGLGTVADEVTQLQNDVAALGNVSQYNYICTGLNDNHALSEIAQTFLSGANDATTMTINVHGKMGVTSAAAGLGTAGSPYKWFNFGLATTTSRRICFDFGNCSQIDFTCPAGTQNIIFSGLNVYVKNAKMRITANDTDTVCVGFDSTNGNVLCERCVIIVNGYSGCYLSATGVFRDCSCSITNSAGVGRCFIPASGSFLRVFGGDYLAYAASGRGSAVVYVPANVTNAAVVVEGVSFPNAPRSGYSQGYSVYDLAANGKSTYIGCVSTLTHSATGQNNFGNIAVNQTTGTW